jgi:cytochrome c biogenesis protein CcmG/thiol:disulfide interchange protein DsbE
MTRNKYGRFRRLALTALALCALLLSACGEQHFQARQAPDFDLPSLDGTGSVSLADHKGQVVYLTFWASWCQPCRQEMPYLAQLWERHQREGFQVLAINVDEDPALAREFVEAYELPFPILLDTDRSLSTTYRIPGFPTHVLVDRRGRIRFSGLGFDLNDVRAVTQEVVTLLAEQPAEAE